MATVSDVNITLNELNAKYRRPGIEDDLRLSEAYLVTSENPEDKFPNAKFPGVYCFFDADDELIYVGKAAEGLGKRLGDYIGKSGNIKKEKISNAKILRTIALPWENYFEAAAIEYFLIGRLQPPVNKHGKNH